MFLSFPKRYWISIYWFKIWFGHVYGDQICFWEGLKQIEWCTICGRPTQDHRHIKKLAPEEELPEGDAKFSAPEVKTVAHHFIGDCKGVGGGGLEEKRNS